MERTWEQLVAPFARLPGLVAEIDDPLTWGLELEEETVAGEDDPGDPSSRRFLRVYRSFAGEEVEVETLGEPCPPEMIDDVLRAAALEALSAPINGDLHRPGTEPQTDAELARYRMALTAAVDAVDAARPRPSTFCVDGSPTSCVRLNVSGMSAVYVAIASAGRAVVISGPADLVNRVEIVLRPVKALLDEALLDQGN
jgi:hypothetical protein